MAQRRSTAFDHEGICHYVTVTEYEDDVDGLILYRTEADCGAGTGDYRPQGEYTATCLECLAGKEEDRYASLRRDFKALGLLR